MRQLRIRLLLIATMVSFGSLSVLAEDASATTLTRVQWLKKIGACVTDDALLRTTLAQVLPDERVEFTRRVLKAVRRLPVSPEEKAAVFVRASVACIASASARRCARWTLGGGRCAEFFMVGRGRPESPR